MIDEMEASLRRIASDVGTLGSAREEASGTLRRLEVWRGEQAALKAAEAEKVAVVAHDLAELAQGKADTAQSAADAVQGVATDLQQSATEAAPHA